jgi:hypothetical protein
MKRTLLSLYVLSISLFSYSQENYEKIFDDGDKESHFQVGINAFTLFGGTPNIYLNAKVSPHFVLTAGVGTSPFGYLFEVSGFIKDDIPTFLTGIKPGFYYNASVKYFFNFTEKAKFDIFGQYYSLGYDHWSNMSTDNVFSYKKSLIIFSSGISLNLPGRFNVDIEYGVYGGTYKANVINPVTEYITTPFLGSQLNPNYIESTSDFTFGISFGLGINYAL